MSNIQNPIFRDIRFGMFLHWGLYAIPAWHEQIQWRRGIPAQKYAEYQQQFNPVNFNPDQWLDLAEEAGMGYICFTAKHHDGFCMWDTRCTDYKITNTPCGKDLLKLLADACHRRGMKLSIYYSCPDWHHENSLNFGGDHQLDCPNPGDKPDLLKYAGYVKKQLHELCTGYGEISQIFWDIPPRINIPEINAMIRELQPGILINDRGYGPGDYSTPERCVPDGTAFEGLAEACQSVGVNSWGFREDEDYFTPAFLIRSMDKIFCMGGNYLLNVGPRADGIIPEPSVNILRAIGKWFNHVKEGIVHTRPVSNWTINKELMLTAGGDSLYVHCPSGLNTTGFALPPINVLPRKATLLNTGSEVSFLLDQLPVYYKNAPCLRIRNLPIELLTTEVPVIKLEFAPGVLDQLAQRSGEWQSYRF